MLYVRLTIKVKVGIPDSFKVGWYPPKITGWSHLKGQMNQKIDIFSFVALPSPNTKKNHPK